MFGRIVRLFSGLVCMCLLSACHSATSEPQYSKYQYDRTKLLVEYVGKAAALLTEKGEGAFQDFSRESERLDRGNRYLFVYDLNGKCLFHPVERELVGRDLLDFKDLDGKPVIRHIIEAATREYPSGGWVHYLWSEPGSLAPLWKTSYVVQVKGPTGKDYVIGSGIYSMRLEKAFIIETVDAAADLIEERGEAALPVFQDKSSRYVYQGVYVFVISMEGRAIVDPAFPFMESTDHPWKGRNLIEFRDAVGKYPAREMIEKLKTDDTAWILVMWPKPDETKPSKKLTYVRKVQMGGQSVIVGSGLYLAAPIWMR
jgi:signal transduction histidine kinase